MRAATECLLCEVSDRDVEEALNFLRELPARLLDLSLQHGWRIAVGVLAMVSVLALVRHLVSRVRHRMLAPGARLVTISCPPDSDPHGAQVLWSQLIGLLRPAWKRHLAGQPHLVWEYAGSASGVCIRVWVPGVVPPGIVEKAVQAAWPGAITSTTPASDPLPPQARAVGGRLALARAEHFPLKTDHASDPPGFSTRRSSASVGPQSSR